MKNRKGAIAAIIVVVVIAAIWWMRRQSAAEMDLLELLPQAEQRSNARDIVGQFGVETVTVEGDARRAVLAYPHARIIWTLTVPQGAWLRTYFAMRPDSWDKPGDGAQFRVGVSDGRTYDEFVRQYINPHSLPGDRRWFSATVDLTAYEGQTVTVIFNTDPGPPRDDNNLNDFALWAEPKIFSRR